MNEKKQFQNIVTIKQIHKLIRMLLDTKRDFELALLSDTQSRDRSVQYRLSAHSLPYEQAGALL